MLAPLLLVLVISLSHICSCAEVASSRWDYDDQSNWPATCRGQNQSPIDLPDICYPKSNIKVDRKIEFDLQRYGALLPLKRLRITNNGHTASVTVTGWDKEVSGAPGISENIAKDRFYQFCELHFHWAQDDTKGSEHSISGSRKALEMHLVHFNTRYGSKNVALNQTDGLLVLGVLFYEDTLENPTLKPIVDQLERVYKTNSSSPVRRSFSLKSLLPPDYNVFYVYRGSLTTPPCYESVIWVIVAEVQKVGYSQLGEFQKMDHFGDRIREIQPLNDRQIIASSDDHCRKETNQGFDSGNNGGYGHGNNRPPGGSHGHGSGSWHQGQGSGNRPDSGYTGNRPEYETGYETGYGSGERNSAGIRPPGRNNKPGHRGHGRHSGHRRFREDIFS